MNNLLIPSLLVLAAATGAGCHHHHQQSEPRIVPQGAKAVFTPSEALVGTWEGEFFAKKPENNAPVISYRGTLTILTTGTLIFQSRGMASPCGGCLLLDAPDRGYLLVHVIDEIGTSLFISKGDGDTLILRNDLSDEPSRFTLLKRVR